MGFLNMDKVDENSVRGLFCHSVLEEKTVVDAKNGGNGHGCRDGNVVDKVFIL